MFFFIFTFSLFGFNLNKIENLIFIKQVIKNFVDVFNYVYIFVFYVNSNFTVLETLENYALRKLQL